jgi:hypothetical protein
LRYRVSQLQESHLAGAEAESGSKRLGANGGAGIAKQAGIDPCSGKVPDLPVPEQIENLFHNLYRINVPEYCICDNGTAFHAQTAGRAVFGKMPEHFSWIKHRLFFFPFSIIVLCATYRTWLSLIRIFFCGREYNMNGFVNQLNIGRKI